MVNVHSQHVWNVLQRLEEKSDWRQATGITSHDQRRSHDRNRKIERNLEAISLMKGGETWRKNYLSWSERLSLITIRPKKKYRIQRNKRKVAVAECNPLSKSWERLLRPLLPLIKSLNLEKHVWKAQPKYRRKMHSLKLRLAIYKAQHKKPLTVSVSLLVFCQPDCRLKGQRHFLCSRVLAWMPIQHWKKQKNSWNWLRMRPLIMTFH